MALKLAVFDFDSTLMDGETLEFLAQDDDLRKKLKLITDRAMAGELDFFESLTQRVAFLEGLSVKHVSEVFKSLPYISGAKELICELKQRGIIVVCFSITKKQAFKVGWGVNALSLLWIFFRDLVKFLNKMLINKAENLFDFQP